MKEFEERHPTKPLEAALLEHSEPEQLSDNEENDLDIGQSEENDLISLPIHHITEDGIVSATNEQDTVHTNMNMGRLRFSKKP